MADTRELAEKHIKLAYYAARNAGDARSLDFDERVSAAMLGLAKAASNYDPDKGAMFHTYALNVIRNELNMELRRMRAEKRTAVLVPLDDTCHKTSPAAEDEAISHIQVKNACARLTQRERRIAALKIHGHSQAAIASCEGLTQATVSRILRNMRVKLE